jgi:hypothetical protein
MTKELSQAAAALGKKGGSSKSERKAEASRKNGRKGGRPRRDPTFCTEHNAYFVECGKLGHGEDFDPKEKL